MIKKREDYHLRVEFIKDENLIEIYDINHSEKSIRFHPGFTIYLIQELENNLKLSEYVCR